MLIRLEKVTKPSVMSLDFTNPQSDRLCTNERNKDTPKARRVIVHKVTKEPRVTSKQLNASLTLTNVTVRESTISRTLNNSGVHGSVARRKPLLSKSKIAARLQFALNHTDNPEGHWRILLWTGETEIELSGLN